MSTNSKTSKKKSEQMVKAVKKIIAHAESVADIATTHEPIIIKFNDHRLPTSDVISFELNTRGIHSKPMNDGIKVFGRIK